MENNQYCLILNHSTKKKQIVKISDLYIAGPENEYNVRATEKDIISLRHGTSASLRITVRGKKTKTIVTVEKIGTQFFYSFII